ncbi:MAG: hypothetical protein M1824_002331 [Vezdaea acicularis]|nr:MAG: hypothetical protein M1824_002331 [Vezdaea acicularis]
MVTVIRRMTKLKTKLFDIRFGPGAATLPRDVKRLHLTFAKKYNGGHMGPRKFWRSCLPRLKYHNPAIPMTIDRIEDQASPSILSIHFASPSSPSDVVAPVASTADPTLSTAATTKTSTDAPSTDKVVEIDMKNKRDSEILDALMKATNAVQVEPSADERAEMEALAVKRARSEEDSRQMREVLERRKYKANMLAGARKLAS